MANTILWVYIVLLIVGGLIGFLKAGSKISLITSVIFAVGLALFAAHVVAWSFGADILLLVLLLVFVVRYAKGRKFMPAGLMIVLTLAALLLRFLVPV
jgi:uncharacterized membrane protein (UPF0136 family)